MEAMTLVRHDEAVLLALLLDAPDAWTQDELARELRWPDHQIEDALAELERCGLARRQGGLVMATRAARRCGELLGHLA